MAAIFRRKPAHKSWPPARHEAMLAVEGAQARKSRVDNPQIGAAPGDFMDVNVAGEMTIARHKDRVVFAGRLEVPGNVRLVAKIPEAIPGADCEPTVITSHA